MKAKASLRCFSNIEDEIDSVFEQPRHPLITYEGIFAATDQQEPEQVDGFCKLRPSKCLHGLYDQSNLAKNVRMIDQYYGQQISWDADFDERYFINHNGL